MLRDHAHERLGLALEPAVHWKSLPRGVEDVEVVVATHQASDVDLPVEDHLVEAPVTLVDLAGTLEAALGHERGKDRLISGVRKAQVPGHRDLFESVIEEAE